MKDTLRRTYLVSGCLTLCCLLSGASALRGDLLLNGSFEEPEVPKVNNFLWFSPGETIGEGWVLDVGLAIVYHQRWTGTPLPPDGDQALLLGGAVFQDVVLPASTSFHLAFQLASEGISPRSLVQIDVWRNGASILQNPPYFQQPSGAPYKPFALDFQTSIADTYRIWVDSRGGEGAYLDAFSLTEVPEPSTLLLLSLGLPVLLVVRRRRGRSRVDGSTPAKPQASNQRRP